MQKKTKQELQEMEKRALKAEKQRDDALDKVKELQHQFYETAVRLEEEQGKNLKLRAQINRDYENSSIPSSKTLRKKKITNSREKTGRKPGGMPPGVQGRNAADAFPGLCRRGHQLVGTGQQNDMPGSECHPLPRFLRQSLPFHPLQADKRP